jgi:hypothetical protein
MWREYGEMEWCGERYGEMEWCGERYGDLEWSGESMVMWRDVERVW